MTSAPAPSKVRGFFLRKKSAKRDKQNYALPKRLFYSIATPFKAWWAGKKENGL
jgi:hypothetical protein